MRLRFNPQLELGVTPINEVVLDLKSRHQLLPILRALQYVFKTPELNEAVFAILEKKVKEGVKETGRYGMDLWQLLVLGMVRHCENADFDRLHDLANNHTALRGIMGVAKSDYTVGQTYHLQTIKDNVRLLDAETINKISAVIVAGGHGLIKKKEVVDCLSLQIKADSFVVESAIHFPTDLNLLWDSVRKSLELLDYFQSASLNLSFSCHCKSWAKKARKAYRSSAETHRKKGANYQERLKKSVSIYLSVAEKIYTRGHFFLTELTENQSITKEFSKVQQKRLSDIKYYLKMVKKHIDLVRRRILLGEKIPHADKVFSIFEPHVEWNSKGKMNKAVELGHNVLIATDQYQYILHNEVYENQVDKQRTVALGYELKRKYAEGYQLNSISFDRGFYSSLAEEKLQQLFRIVVLPKAGRQSKLELTQEENVDYQDRKRSHSCVEGNINQLEQNGLDVCPDKGMEGFKRYVAYGVLSYNAHQLGMELIRQERQVAKRAKLKRKRRKAA